MNTIRTTAIVPVDLNSLLYGLEEAISRGCGRSARCRLRAALRGARAPPPARPWTATCGMADAGYFTDYDWRRGTRTGELSAATLYPLFVGLAPRRGRPRRSRQSCDRNCCKGGGIVTTTIHSGQQWDAPNGWAPLQWIAVRGLARYGDDALAHDIAGRWLATVRRVYANTGKMFEKYDVEHALPGGGGEYPVQDGFGWTNGVTRGPAAALPGPAIGGGAPAAIMPGAAEEPPPIHVRPLSDPSQAAAERYWRVIEPLWHFEPSWRVLPTDPVPVVLSVTGAVTGRMMRWGLLPFRGESNFPLINATVEKLETWYAWKQPWERRQRCILVMAGFYEPHLFEDGRKEPFYVHLADRPVFGVAGLWDRKRQADGTEVLSCALITAAAEQPHGGDPQREAAHAGGAARGASRGLAAGQPGGGESHAGASPERHHGRVAGEPPPLRGPRRRTMRDSDRACFRAACGACAQLKPRSAGGAGAVPITELRPRARHEGRNLARSDNKMGAPPMPDDHSILTATLPAHLPAGVDLRRTAANPDYWYPLAWSDELKPGRILGGVSPGSPSRSFAARAAGCSRSRIAARIGRCRCTSAWCRGMA